MAEIEAAAAGAEQQKPRPQLSDFSVYEDGIVWNASLVLLNHFRSVRASVVIPRIPPFCSTLSPFSVFVSLDGRQDKGWGPVEGQEGRGARFGIGALGMGPLQARGPCDLYRHPAGRLGVTEEKNSRVAGRRGDSSLKPHERDLATIP